MGKTPGMSISEGSELARSAGGAARRVSDSKWLERLARVGWLIDGLLHLLIGYIAVRLAMSGSGGGGRGSADQSGALATLAQSGAGRIALWVGVVGFACLALWQATNALFSAGTSGTLAGDSTDRMKDRAKSAGKAVLYAALAVLTLRFAQGGSSSTSQESADFTASMIDTGPGRLLIVAIGLAVAGIGLYLVHKGWTKKFLRDLEQTGGREVSKAVRALGQAGYVAKGVVITIVGALFVLAAVRQTAGEATGIDGALRKLLEQPYGSVLLVAIGLGLAAFGVYLFARARFARM